MSVNITHCIQLDTNYQSIAKLDRYAGDKPLIKMIFLTPCLLTATFCVLKSIATVFIAILQNDRNSELFCMCFHCIYIEIKAHSVYNKNLKERVMPRVATENSSRFPMQIPPAEKARLMRAAAIERTSLKDFVLRNALIAAEAVIEKAERISMDDEQTRFILNLLDNPPKPNAKLLSAAQALAARK
jgi:uncharacterized protein (DUF1778 family)